MPLPSGGGFLVVVRQAQARHRSENVRVRDDFRAVSDENGFTPTSCLSPCLNIHALPIK